MGNNNVSRKRRSKARSTPLRYRSQPKSKSFRPHNNANKTRHNTLCARVVAFGGLRVRLDLCWWLALPLCRLFGLQFDKKQTQRQRARTPSTSEGVRLANPATMNRQQRPRPPPPLLLNQSILQRLLPHYPQQRPCQKQHQRQLQFRPTLFTQPLFQPCNQ